MQKKIIIVAGFYPYIKGGAEYQMRLIADHLKGEYEIVFVYLGDAPNFLVDRTKCEIIDGYKIYSIQSCSKWDNFVLKYFYSRRLYKVLKKERPDIVYQRVLKFSSVYLSSFSIKLDYKFFIHIADLFSISFYKNSLKNKFNYRVFKHSLKYDPNFIVQTNEQKEILESYGVEPVLQIYNMHPKVDIDILLLAERKYKNDEKFIVWVANIRKIKQIELFLDMAERYETKAAYRFVVIGNIQDEAYAQPLVRRIRQSANILYYIGKDNTFVNKFIEEHAALIVNTSYTEGFSNVFIQSWMRGVPVLSLNSNPDGLFDRYPCLGKCCNGSLFLLMESVEKIVENDEYIQDACTCYNESSHLFSFGNMKLLKSLL